MCPTEWTEKSDECSHRCVGETTVILKKSKDYPRSNEYSKESFINSVSSLPLFFFWPSATSYFMQNEECCERLGLSLISKSDKIYEKKKNDSILEVENMESSRHTRIRNRAWAFQYIFSFVQRDVHLVVVIIGQYKICRNKVECSGILSLLRHSSNLLLLWLMN